MWLRANLFNGRKPGGRGSPVTIHIDTVVAFQDGTGAVTEWDPGKCKEVVVEKVPTTILDMGGANTYEIVPACGAWLNERLGAFTFEKEWGYRDWRRTDE